jgi:hypothetical protein
MHGALLAVAAGLVLALVTTAVARAQMPGQIIDAPPPQSAGQKAAPLDSAFRDRLVEPGQIRATGALEKALEGLPAFLRDTNLTLKPRTYYFDQSDPSGTIEEAWAPAVGGRHDQRRYAVRQPAVQSDDAERVSVPLI